jgi:hypothetical protein
MDAGNVPKYKDFGKAIFRNLNGTDTYNRVDKINVNNSRIVNPAHAGRDFGLISKKVEPKTVDKIVKHQ